MHSPDSTRKSSWACSEWYSPFGWPGGSTCRRKPNSENRAYGVSNGHSEPVGRPLPPSDVSHSASRTLTVNQPFVVGPRPEPGS